MTRWFDRGSNASNDPNRETHCGSACRISVMGCFSRIIIVYDLVLRLEVLGRIRCMKVRTLI
jgi:hypothetical protein